MSEVADALTNDAPPAAPAPPAPPAPAAPPPPAAGSEPPPPAAPQDRWQDKFLSEEYRGNEHIARYGSLDDLAKAHVETVTWARGRIPIPPVVAADADEATRAAGVAAFNDFASKIRPEKAEDYKILDGEGKPSAVGEAFRGKFHELGLHPVQAEGIVAAWNQYQADTVSQASQAANDELKAVELEYGPAGYAQRTTAVGNMLAALGVEIEDIGGALQQAAGAGAAMRGLFALAEKTGELAKVDPTDVRLQMGAVSAADARAEIDRQNASGDPEFMKRLADPDSAEAKRRRKLFEIIAKG